MIDTIPFRITPLQSIQTRCELLAETFQEKKAAKAQHTLRLDTDLCTRRVFRGHAAFLDELLRTGQTIDHDLCEAAVWHACRSTRDLPHWDGGRQAWGTWEPIRTNIIDAFGLQDKLAWAAELRYRAQDAGIRWSRNETLEKLLPKQADLYLREVLLHVTRDDNR